MAGQSEVASIREKFGLTQDELIDHFGAYHSLSNYGNHRPIDAIPEEKRDRIAQFYKELRSKNIYCYNPDTGKSQERIGYVESWVRLLKNDRNRPEMQNVTSGQVKAMISAGIEDVKNRMAHGTPMKEPHAKAIKRIGELTPITAIGKPIEGTGDGGLGEINSAVKEIEW